MVTASLLLLIAVNRGADADLTFCCKPDNDLYRMVRQTGKHCVRFDSRTEAFERAKPGSSVLLLGDQDAEGYTDPKAPSKNLKVYVEEPIHKERTKGGFVLDTLWLRVIVTSDQFGPELEQGRILSIGSQMIPAVSAKDPLLSIGRVAGFDKLAFGMPSTTNALLWSPDKSTLKSCATLSSFGTSRFAPAKAWKPVIQTILRWLGAPETASLLQWNPGVRPTFSAKEALPGDVERIAQQRAAAWFSRSKLLVAEKRVYNYNTAEQWPDRVGPMPDIAGDGTYGMLEGYSSAIDALGMQPVRWYRRADCNAESAMALIQAGNRDQRQIGGNIADFIAGRSTVLHDDPAKQSFGLVGWNDLGPYRGTFYGDDNARYILGLIGASGGLKQNRWDDQILKCILANFRTSGANGFRGDSLGEGDIERQGWRHFYDAATVNMAPHFEAYLWACYLWAYDKTGYKPLLERTEKAIARVIASGEDAWTWTNGSQQERARMLLPLAWLVRVHDTPVHRTWLADMAKKVIGYQAECGAIREEFGDLSHGIAGPPRSNEAFGTAEAPLIQENGDPLADMLYTSNFAFLGLHEAAAVTRDAKLVQAENKLAEFLCRIQIKSSTHPELDGAWFRAFDYGDWDFWASNSDLGWGAWSIESGWSVSWITTILALRTKHLAFWDVHPGFRVNQGLVKMMLP